MTEKVRLSGSRQASCPCGMSGKKRRGTSFAKMVKGRMAQIDKEVVKTGILQTKGTKKQKHTALPVQNS